MVRDLAILTAMLQEMRPLARRLQLEPAEIRGMRVLRGELAGVRVTAAVTGMGTSAARRNASALLDRVAADHAMIVGIAGAISPDVAIGELLHPAALMDARSGSTLSLPGAASKDGGILLTTDELITDPEQVAALAERGIVAVDMETFAVAEACEQRCVEWSVFRAISDRAGEPATDTEVLGMVNPDGSAGVRAAARYLLRHPQRIAHLARLAAGTRRATSAAARAAAEAALDLSRQRPDPP